MATLPWLFLHGVNNVPSIWLPIVAALDHTLEASCPVLVPLDSMEALGGEIAASLSGPVIVVGHSLGGYVALDVLARHPELIHGIVLINSISQADTQEMASARSELSRRALDGEFFAIAEGAAQRSYHADSLERSELMDQRNEDVKAYGAVRFAAHQTACAARLDRTAELRNFDGPKLVITAGGDAVISPTEQKSMAEYCSADFILISDAGHMLPAEQPERVAQALNNWRHEKFDSLNSP